jgi:hypothetical protein
MIHMMILQEIALLEIALLEIVQKRMILEIA